MCRCSTFFITITIFVFTVIATGQKLCLLQYYALRLLLGIGVNLLVARASIFILLSTTLRRKILYQSFPTRPHVSLRWIMFIYIPPVTRLQEGGVTFPHGIYRSFSETVFVSESNLRFLRCTWPTTNRWYEVDETWGPYFHQDEGACAFKPVKSGPGGYHGDGTSNGTVP